MTNQKCHDVLDKKQVGGNNWKTKQFPHISTAYYYVILLTLSMTFSPVSISLGILHMIYTSSGLTTPNQQRIHPNRTASFSCFKPKRVWPTKGTLAKSKSKKSWVKEFAPPSEWFFVASYCMSWRIKATDSSRFHLLNQGLNPMNKHNWPVPIYAEAEGASQIDLLTNTTSLAQFRITANARLRIW